MHVQFRSSSTTTTFTICCVNLLCCNWSSVYWGGWLCLGSYIFKIFPDVYKRLLQPSLLLCLQNQVVLFGVALCTLYSSFRKIIIGYLYPRCRYTNSEIKNRAEYFINSEFVNKHGNLFSIFLPKIESFWYEEWIQM